MNWEIKTKHPKWDFSDHKVNLCSSMFFQNVKAFLNKNTGFAQHEIGF